MFTAGTTTCSGNLFVSNGINIGDGKTYTIGGSVSLYANDINGLHSWIKSGYGNNAVYYTPSDVGL